MVVHERNGEDKDYCSVSKRGQSLLSQQWASGAWPFVDVVLAIKWEPFWENKEQGTSLPRQGLCDAHYSFIMFAARSKLGNLAPCYNSYIVDRVRVMTLVSSVSSKLLLTSLPIPPCLFSSWPHNHDSICKNCPFCGLVRYVWWSRPLVSLRNTSAFPYLPTYNI